MPDLLEFSEIFNEPIREYRLYCKSEHGKNFNMVNWKDGSITRSTLFATMFTLEEGNQALEEARRMNPTITFELRKVKGL